MQDYWSGQQLETSKFEIEIHSGSLGLPTFKTDQGLIELTVGEEQEWTLPEINCGIFGLADVQIEPDSDINPLLIFD